MTEFSEYIDGIHQGNAEIVLSDLPDDSIHFVMTSPPYWGMRDYGVDEQIGLEESIELYINSLADIGDELQRVLRDDGSWWLNLGDSYASSGGSSSSAGYTRSSRDEFGKARNKVTRPFPEKCRMMAPHRVALELIDRGWSVRNDVLWKKKNPMPEPVTDRLSTSFEYVFHLVQQDDYYYDPEAAERCAVQSDYDLLSDVWVVSTEGFSGAHFAVYPEQLVELPLRATCPPLVCPDCGTPYERTNNRRTSICGCDAGNPVGGVALDPMCGRGTTCKVASEHGRRYIGFDLNPEYVEIARNYLPDAKQQTLTKYR